MLRFVADENFDNGITWGMRARDPSVDIVRVQDEVIAEHGDPDVIQWTFDNDRIVLTHDAKTFGKFSYERMGDGGHVAGVIVVPDSMSKRAAIEELLLIHACTDMADWVDVVKRLPL